MKFQLDATSGGARATTLTMAHGEVQTPVFMPVGTQATVKALDYNDMLSLGAQIIFHIFWDQSSANAFYDINEFVPFALTQRVCLHYPLPALTGDLNSHARTAL